MEAIKNKVTNLEKRMEKVEIEIKDIEKIMTRSTTEISVIFKMLNEIQEDTKKISEDIADLKFKPTQNWENLIKTVITVITTAVVTYFISK